MAMGIPQYDPRLDMANMQLNSQLLQSLGSQLRSDVQTIQTNRQLKGFAQGLQEVSPQSSDFVPKITGLMSQFPMAVNSPIGKAAISQLGTEHQYWQRAQTSATTNRYQPIPGTNAVLDKRTGETTMLPEGARPEKPLVVKTPTGAVVLKGDAQTEFGDPFPDESPAMKLEGERQQNRIELEKLRQQKPIRATVVDPEARALGTALSSTLSKYATQDAVAKKLETEWNLMTGDPKSDPERIKAGAKASAARQAAETLKSQVNSLSIQLKARSAPVDNLGANAIPGLGAPTASAPEPSIPAAGIEPAMPSGPMTGPGGPDTLIPAALTQPANKKFRYVPGQGLVPQ